MRLFNIFNTKNIINKNYLHKIISNLIEGYEIIFDNSNNSKQYDDYQFKINLNSSNFDFSKISDNGDNIYFVDSNKKTIIPFWIENLDKTNQNADIWIKIPTILSNSIKKVYLTFGNETSPLINNENEVFDFYDDFNNLNNWSIVENENFIYSINEDVLNIDMNGSASRTFIMDSNLQYDHSLAIEAKLNLTSTYGISGRIGHTIYFFTSQIFVAEDPITNDGKEDHLTLPRDQYIITKEIYNKDTNMTKIIFDNNSTDWHTADSLWITSSNSKVCIGAFDHSGTTGGNFYIDWIRIYKYDANLPNYFIKGKL